LACGNTECGRNQKRNASLVAELAITLQTAILPPSVQFLRQICGNFTGEDTKFEVAYFVVKEEMPLSKYPQLLQLEENHRVEIGFAYQNNVNSGMFIDSRELGLKLCDKLSTVYFYSILSHHLCN
jgi:hypothetical protein